MKKENWSARQWADYYEALEHKNYMTFQETGISRYDNAQRRYGQIAEAFRALDREKNENEVDMKKRMNNCNAAIERLDHGKTYDFDEVSDLLKSAVWW
jgi:phage-related minor tail protein